MVGRAPDTYQESLATTQAALRPQSPLTLPSHSAPLVVDFPTSRRGWTTRLQSVEIRFHRSAIAQRLADQQLAVGTEVTREPPNLNFEPPNLLVPLFVSSLAVLITAGIADERPSRSLHQLFLRREHLVVIDTELARQLRRHLVVTRRG